MAREFEILNAKVNIDVNSKNAGKELEQVSKSFSKLRTDADLTLNQFTKFSNKLIDSSSGIKNFGATLVSNGQQFEIASSSANQFAVTIKNSTSAVDEQTATLNKLTERLDILNKESLSLGRNLSGVFNDVRDSIALVGAGGNVFVAIQQAMFGLGQQGGIVGKVFGFLTRDTDNLGRSQGRLQQASLRTAQKLADVGLAAQDALKLVGTAAKTEGIASRSEFAILTTQIQNVTNEYQRLERVILTGGKPTAAELQRIKVEARGLQTAFQNLVRQGIIPAGSQTEIQLKKIIKSMSGGEQGVKLLTQQMKALDQEAFKAAQTATQVGTNSEQAAKKGTSSWLSFFNIFKFGRKEISSVNTSLETTQSTIKETSGLVTGLKLGFAGLLGGAAIGGLATIIPAVFDGLKSKLTGSIQAASDAAEEMSKFSVVFDSVEDSAKGMNDALVQSVLATIDDMAATLGRSRYELRALAATFQDTFVPLGFGREEAAKLSIGVTELTEDLSSFYNLTEREVGDSLSSFLVGNYENARKFGSVVTDARLDAELLKLGVEGGTEAVDQQTKAMVALKLLYNDTSDAQGDALRTASGFANQMRLLQGRARDAAVEFGNKLLPIANLLLSVFLRFQTEVGPAVANVFNGITSAITPFVNAFSTIISGGSIDEVFTSIQIIVQNAILSLIDTLNSFIPVAGNWAYEWGVELYNGLLDVVDLVYDAVTQIANAMYSLLAPGSPPEEGPLSNIDEWGAGLMETFNDGLVASDVGKSLEEKLANATTNILKLRQEIIDAERAGYVPPELIEKLKLAEKEKQIIQDQISQQKNLGKEQKKNAKEQKKAGGAKGGGGAGSRGDRAQVEKKTAQQIRDEALTILDQQLKDGTIKYEEYVKEKLKIEKKFYQDTLEAGETVNQDVVDNIKNLQKEVDALNPPKDKKGKGKLLGLDDLGLTVDDFLPKPVELRKNVQKVVASIASTAVTSFQTKIKESGTKLQESLVTNIASGFQKVRDFIKGLTVEQVFPFTVVAGALATPIVGFLLNIFSSLISVITKVVGIFGGLGNIIKFLTKTTFKFSVLGLIVYGIFQNWDEIVADATMIFGLLTESVGTMVGNVKNFINAFKNAKGVNLIIDNFLSGISVLALAFSNILALVKKVVKVVFIGGIVFGFNYSIEVINNFTTKFIESFGSMDDFAQDLVDVLVVLSDTFAKLSKKIFDAVNALFAGDFDTFITKLTEIPALLQSAFGNEKVISFFSNVGSAIKNALPPALLTFFGQVRDIFNQVVESIRVGLQPTVERLSPVMTQLKDLWANLQVTFVQILPLLQKAAIIIGAILAVAIAIVIDTIVSLLQIIPDVAPFFVGAFGGVLQVINGVIEVFNGLVLALNAGWALIFGDTNQATTLIQQSMQTLLNGFTDIFGGIYTTIINLGAGILVAVESFVVNFVANIARAFGFDQYADKIIALKDGFVNLLNILSIRSVEIMQGLIDQIITIFTLLLPQLDDIIGGMIDSILGWFTKLYNDIIGHSIIPDMIAGILNAFNIFDTDLGVLVETIINNLIGLFSGVGSNIIQNIISGLQTGKSLLLDALSSLFGGGDQQAAQPTSLDTSQGTQLLGFIAQALPSITTTVTTLQSIFTTFTTSVMSLITSLLNTLNSSFILLRENLIGKNSIIDEIAAGVLARLSNMSALGVQVLEQFVTVATTTMRSSAWFQVGKDIINGIINGINENRGKFLNKIKQLAREGIDAAEAELGISSPSIAFIEIGAEMVAGLAEGLKNLVPTVGTIVGAARDEAEKVMEANVDPNKVKAILTAAGRNFRASFDEVIALAKSGKMEEAIKKLSKGISFKALGIQGGEQGKTVAKGLEAFIKNAILQTGKQVDKFKAGVVPGLASISDQALEVVNKFRTATENVRFQTNNTRNQLEDIFKTPITDTFLADLNTQLANGADFGDDINSKIKIAFLSQQKLNGALEENAAIEEQIRNIKLSQTAINDLLGVQQTEQTDAVAETENAAMELLNSLNLGIGATVPEVLGQLSQVAVKMIEQMKKALELGSPSRVFIDIGKNIGLGLTEGIVDSTKNISALGTNAITNLTAGVNSAIMTPDLQPALATANNGQNVIINIENNINDKMDLALIERRITNTIIKAIKT